MKRSICKNTKNKNEELSAVMAILFSAVSAFSVIGNFINAVLTFWLNIFSSFLIYRIYVLLFPHSFLKAETFFNPLKNK